MPLGFHSVIGATVSYLTAGTLYFLRDINYEFIIYVGAIAVIFMAVFLLQPYTKFPLWMLWLLSVWGLLHVLGGAVEINGAVLFEYRIYPFLDQGGEFYILKYDQVVHAYGYGVLAVLCQHLFLGPLRVAAPTLIMAMGAVLVSVGVGSLNEIMEFLITLTIPDNGVGDGVNTALDLVSNFVGAVLGVGLYTSWQTRRGIL